MKYACKYEKPSFIFDFTILQNKFTFINKKHGKVKSPKYFLLFIRYIKKNMRYVYRNLSINALYHTPHKFQFFFIDVFFDAYFETD